MLRLRKSLVTAGWADSREIVALEEAVIILSDDENENYARSKAATRISGKKDESKSKYAGGGKETGRTDANKTTLRGRSQNVGSSVKSSLITPPRRTPKLRLSFSELYGRGRSTNVHKKG